MQTRWASLLFAERVTKLILVEFFLLDEKYSRWVSNPLVGRVEMFTAGPTHMMLCFDYCDLCLKV